MASHAFRPRGRSLPRSQTKKDRSDFEDDAIVDCSLELLIS